LGLGWLCKAFRERLFERIQLLKKVRMT